MAECANVHVQVLIQAGPANSGSSSDRKPAGDPAGSAGLQATGAVANTATPRGDQAEGKPEGSLARQTEGESRKIETGHDWLDNNGVNVLMAFLMSVGAMGIAQQAWGVGAQELWTQIVWG